MSGSFVHIGLVDVYDNKVFTHEVADEWFSYILSCCNDIEKRFLNELPKDTFINFFISDSLIDEAIVDAIIGMRKITDSEFNKIESPNAFKIISYLAYWFMRYKPVAVLYSGEKNDLNNVEIKHNDKISEEEYEEKRQTLIWRLKHINEIIAVQMVANYIFNFENVLCDNERCEVIKQKDTNNFCFSNFIEMRDVLLKKLTYYFSYRTIAPKIIEHILEAYTLHPAWGLTGQQWNSAYLEAVGP